MKLQSVFNNNDKIPEKYTCDGDDINPLLEISDIPENTKTLVLIVDDPDAPMGIWVHWILFNIPVIGKIEENSVPEGAVQGINDFKKPEYGGPCPPGGTHRYFFKLYALDTELDLAEGATKAEVEQAMKNHVLDKTELVGLYSRN
ncbi:YbhB/YbcL family Raf kinase inhibitor-like protein [Candidatus Pacearchaeota archaeon]|nr:YbhB/YbcL family Raf kinase inhibitor-like protein [Candidatus Pacearchaeota archaeon]MBD3283105.1 YbhB/YbcL family Raf kinase inhibitor-like protein [Candidatus Pacearchaeota archaeon]